MSKKVAFAVNLNKEEAIDCGEAIIKFLKKENAYIIMNERSKKYFKHLSDGIHYKKDSQSVFESADVAITAGGDGTIIHYAKYAAKAQKPLIGINVGRLGFAAELEPEEICELKYILDDNYKTQKRMILHVDVYQEDSKKEFIAINDAVISKGNLSRIIDLSVYLKDVNFENYRADGLVIATPTGSTAYALSAGGPVIEPEMECILLTPICSHSLYARSIVFDKKAVLSVMATAPELEEFSYLTIDGQEVLAIGSNDRVEIRKSEYELELISLKDRNFYKHLSEKLKGREN